MLTNLLWEKNTNELLVDSANKLIRTCCKYALLWRSVDIACLVSKISLMYRWDLETYKILLWNENSNGYQLWAAEPAKGRYILWILVAGAHVETHNTQSGRKLVMVQFGYYYTNKKTNYTIHLETAIKIIKSN